MSQVSMTINGRVYRLTCEEGEEERLMQLGAAVSKRVGQFTDAFGQVGDNRLLFLAALRLADELMDATTKLDTGAQVETLRPQTKLDRKSAKSAPAPDSGTSDTKAAELADAETEPALDPLDA